MAGLKMKYFVLNPDSSDKDYALASRAAMEAFARSIQDTNQQLADDLVVWVEGCDQMDAERAKSGAE